MPKKLVRVIINGKPRSAIDVDAMTQIVIALGRELAARKQVEVAPQPTRTKATSP